MSIALFETFMAILARAPEAYKKVVELWAKINPGNESTVAELLDIYNNVPVSSYEADIEEAKRRAGLSPGNG